MGFTRAQAEALAEEQARLIDERLATKTDIATVNGNIEALRLATKADIESLRLATSADIATVNGNIEGLRQSTKSDLELLRRDLVIKMGAMMIGAVAVVSAVVTLVARFPFRS